MSKNQPQPSKIATTARLVDLPFPQGHSGTAPKAGSPADAIPASDLFLFPINHDLQAPRADAPADVAIGMQFKTRNGVVNITGVSETHVTYRYLP